MAAAGASLAGRHQQHAAARAQAQAHAPTRPGERRPPSPAAPAATSAATDQALHQQTGQSRARLGWEQVNRVDRDDQRHVLILTGLTPAVPARTVLRLAKEWHLPALAAERVSWTKALDQRISSTEVPQRVWSPSACPAQRASPGRSSSTAGSIPQAHRSGPSRSPRSPNCEQ